MTNQLATVSEYLRSDVSRARFAEVLGERNVGAYISSVLIAVANSDKLQECSAQSIYSSALRAATLRLSVDPGLGQAYLVPYKGKATLIPGYKGYHDLAIRTGKYRYINVGKVFEGEEVVEDRMSGFHKLSGQRTGDKVIGWIAAFEMVNGYGKTIYMSIEEIHEHARRYNPTGYNSETGVWKKETQAMERKTVLRQLLHKWGYMDPTDAQVLNEIEKDVSDVIDAEVVEVASDVRLENEPEPELYGTGETQTEQSLATETPAEKAERIQQDFMKDFGYGV